MCEIWDGMYLPHRLPLKHLRLFSFAVLPQRLKDGNEIFADADPISKLQGLAAEGLIDNCVLIKLLLPLDLTSFDRRIRHFNVTSTHSNLKVSRNKNQALCSQPKITIVAENISYSPMDFNRLAFNPGSL